MPARAQQWMLLEGPQDGEARYRSRFESIGVVQPERILTTEELLASAKHHPDIDLERLTGIVQRHVCSEGEDSMTLAVGAAKDCLAHSRYAPEQIDMLINCSISKNEGGLSHRYEPAFAQTIASSIGAESALAFDISNACAGMLTGVLVLDDFIRRGVIRRGMVVSGESISNLGVNAAKQIRSILSKQLASLTLGDAGAAAIVERAPSPGSEIVLAGFTTLSQHSRLCIGYPSKVGPGATMLTDARGIHRVAIAEAPMLLKEAVEHSGIAFDDIEWLIPHQTSARAIKKGTKAIADKLGITLKNVVENVTMNGNTASTTHFVTLYQYLMQRRFKPDDHVLLVSFASGLEIGVVLFSPGELVEHYGNPD